MANLTPRENQAQSKAFHQATLDAIGEHDAPFLSKMAFCPTSVGLSDKHVGFFDSEIKAGKDVYIEFGDKEMLPEEVSGFPFRSLLKWRFNPHYKTEYTPSNPDPKSGNLRYFVPISELILITKPASKLRTSTEVPERESKVSEIVSKVHDGPDETDLLTRDMTILDYAAIHLKRPVSKRAWLNKIISNI